MIDSTEFIDAKLKKLFEAPKSFTSNDIESLNAMDSMVWTLLILREELAGRDASIVDRALIATRIEFFNGHGPQTNMKLLRMRFGPELENPSWMDFYRRWWGRIAEGGPL